MWSAALFTIPLHCLLLHFQFRTDPSSPSFSFTLTPSFSLRLFLLCLYLSPPDGVCDVYLFPLPCAVFLFLSSLCVGWKGSRGTGVESSVRLCVYKRRAREWYGGGGCRICRAEGWLCWVVYSLGQLGFSLFVLSKVCACNVCVWVCFCVQRGDRSSACLIFHHKIDAESNHNLIKSWPQRGPASLRADTHRGTFVSWPV